MKSLVLFRRQSCELRETDLYTIRDLMNEWCACSPGFLCQALEKRVLMCSANEMRKDSTCPSCNVLTLSAFVVVQLSRLLTEEILCLSPIGSNFFLSDL